MDLELVPELKIYVCVEKYTYIHIKLDCPPPTPTPLPVWLQSSGLLFHIIPITFALIKILKKGSPSNSFLQDHLMEIYWHIPRIKQVKSSRRRANPEASNMMAPLRVSVSRQSPRWSRRLSGATRRSVSAKHASLLRHKMKADRCHFVWRQKVLGRGRNTNQTAKGHS